MDAPPSLSQWRLEDELAGHSPAQTIAHLARCADWAGYLEERRSRAPEQRLAQVDSLAFQAEDMRCGTCPPVPGLVSF